MIKHLTLMAVTAACFLNGASVSGTLLASPQSAERSASNAAETTEGQWIKHAADGSNAEIMMPAKPRLSERTFRPVADEPFIQVKTWLCSANGKQIVFTMSYHDLHEKPVTRKKIKQTLDGAVKGTVAQVVGNIKDTVEEVKVRTYPGRKFSYEFMLGDQALKSDAEVYLIGKRQYMLSTIFKPSNYQPELSQKFFETFNPFDPEDETLAAGSFDASDSNADSQGTGFDGLTLPSGEQPTELK
jgi:hypothetical protein